MRKRNPSATPVVDSMEEIAGLLGELQDAAHQIARAAINALAPALRACGARESPEGWGSARDYALAADSDLERAAKGAASCADLVSKLRLRMAGMLDNDGPPEEG